MVFKILKWPLFIKDVMVKEQAMLTEEEISGHDQKMFPNVEQANDGCKNGSQKETSAAIKLQSRVGNSIIIPWRHLMAAYLPSFHNFPLTNLNVKVFKALGSSTIFCKLAATEKYKHGEKCSNYFP